MGWGDKLDPVDPPVPRLYDGKPSYLDGKPNSYNGRPVTKRPGLPYDGVDNKGKPNS